MEKVLKMPLVFKTVKAKTAVTIFAVICAVVLPQIFHTLGAALNMGTALGEVFLPMHISVLLVGLLAGPVAGAITGSSAPVISFLLTGMPSYVMLPFMIAELAAYGFFAGITAKLKIPSVVKLLTAQIAGRAVRAVAIFIGCTFFSSKVLPITVLSAVSKGLPGLILQWTLIPLIVFLLEKIRKNDRI